MSSLRVAVAVLVTDVIGIVGLFSVAYFVRVGEARDRESGGYGLGLAIAERAIRLHQGNISAANAAGGGVCVTVRLPARAETS